MAPAIARSILFPESTCFTQAFAASSVSRALKCLKFSSRKVAIDIGEKEKMYEKLSREEFVLARGNEIFSRKYFCFCFSFFRNYFGCCWEMQCSEPYPKINSRQSIPTIFRLGKSFRSVSSATSSDG